MLIAVGVIAGSILLCEIGKKVIDKSHSSFIEDVGLGMWGLGSMTGVMALTVMCNIYRGII